MLNRTSSVMVAFFTASISCAFAAHEEAVVSDIDGDGFETYSGFYIHQDGPLVDHPWFTFNANSGQDISITLETDFSVGGNTGSYMWLYEVLDGEAMVGDASAYNGGTELLLFWQSYDDPDFLGSAGLPDDSHDVTVTIPSTNQYILQVDSWIGGSGDYSLAITPEPNAMALICAAFLTEVIARRRKAVLFRVERLALRYRG